MEAIVDASESPPADYVHQQGWVIIALQNALWQLVHAATLEDGVVDTLDAAGVPTQMLQLPEPSWVPCMDSAPYRHSGSTSC